MLPFGVLVIYISCLTGSSLSDCGRPGNSIHSKIDSDLDKRSYLEGTSLEYFCRTEDIIIGHRFRTCRNNKWTGSVPKCAAMITSTIKYAYNKNAIIVSTPTPTKIVGITLQVTSRFNVKLREVKNIPEWNCTRKEIEAEDDNPLDKGFLFTCATKRVDMNNYDLRNWAIAVFSHNLGCQPPLCKTRLEEAAIYAVTSDDCQEPDQPRYGSSFKVDEGVTYESTGSARQGLKREVREISEKDFNITVVGNIPDSRGKSDNSRKGNITHRYECDEDFRPLDLKKTFVAYCPPNGDWKIKPKLPACVPKHTCELLLVPDEINADYSDLYGGQSVAEGTVVYTCLDQDSYLVGGKKRLECLTSGLWGGNPPTKCVPRKKDPGFPTVIVAVIGAVILICVIIALFVWFSNRRSDAQASSRSISSRPLKSPGAPKNPCIRALAPAEYYSDVDSRYMGIVSNEPPIYDVISEEPDYDEVQCDQRESSPYINPTSPSAYYCPMTRLGEEDQVHLRKN